VVEDVAEVAKRLISDARRARRLPRKPSPESTARVAAVLKSAEKTKNPRVEVAGSLHLRRTEVARTGGRKQL
jgi:hypothetical protein